MKKVINGIKIVKNEASLYVNGRMQYQAINLVAEYGTRLNGCKYAITSKYPQWKMEKRFGKSLDRFRPYIFLTRKEYEPIRESQNNDSKFRMRGINCHDPYGYTGELTEILHDCQIICADPEPDVLTKLVEACDDARYEGLKASLREALNELTEIQRNRIMLYYGEGKTYRQIAALEGTNESAIRKSVAKAEKNIREYFKKHVIL